MNEKNKPWYGKRCTKCDAPINYAYKGIIEGWCGKCTDAVRREIMQQMKGDQKFVQIELPPSRFGLGFGLGIVTGFIVAFAIPLALAVYVPGTWAQIIAKLAGALGKT